MSNKKFSREREEIYDLIYDGEYSSTMDYLCNHIQTTYKDDVIDVEYIEFLTEIAWNDFVEDEETFAAESLYSDFDGIGIRDDNQGELYENLIKFLLKKNSIEIFKIIMKVTKFGVDDKLLMIISNFPNFSFYLIDNDIGVAILIVNIVNFIYFCENKQIDTNDPLDYNFSAEHVQFLTKKYKYNPDNLNENSYYYNDELFIKCIKKPMDLTYFDISKIDAWKIQFYKENI